MMQVADCTPDEKDALLHNRCPACGNYGFHDGPTGGMSLNIFCCNPHCRAGFNIGPMLILAQRIPRGRLCHYPPLTHATDPEGRPVCLFTIRPAPYWPRGHTSAGAKSPEVTCPDCVAALNQAARIMGNPVDRIRETLRRLKGEGT